MSSIKKIKDLIESCLLPKLTQDLDSIPIEREHFKAYHESLRIQLPILYDWIQELRLNKLDLIDDAEDEIKQETLASLIVLLCEISFPTSIYKLDETELIKNAERILQNAPELSKKEDELIFKYYEDKLHKDEWKKQLGSVHGFIKYLEFHFSNSHDHDPGMSQKMIMFCLSVALNIRSCYETHYKALSTTIFLTILQQGSNDDIVSMNIHSVIYDAVFKDVHIMDSIPFIVKQWNCLINCLDFYKNIDSFTWNNLDDMMEVLLRNISLAPDTATSICLLRFVNKLIVYFTINRKEYEEFIDNDLKQINEIPKYRSLGLTNTSYTNYRWAKDILQMFIVESYKLMQTTENCYQMLQEMHKIYILTILPIKLEIIEPHLKIFLDKFIAILMEAIKVHKYEDNVMPVITSVLETFYFNLQNSNESENLLKFKENIFALLKMEAFIKYTTL